MVAAETGVTSCPLPRPTISASSHAARALRMKVRNECRKLPGIDRRAHLAHQLQVIVQVVDGVQARAQDLAAAVQMVQVSAREVAAGVTIAGLVERLFVVLVACILDLDVAETGED